MPNTVCVPQHEYQIQCLRAAIQHYIPDKNLVAIFERSDSTVARGVTQLLPAQNASHC